MEMAAKRIYTAHVTLKEFARNSARAQYAWDSGSVTVLGMDLQTRTQAGTQCLGSTWKKYLPHRLKLTRADLIRFLKRGQQCYTRNLQINVG